MILANDHGLYWSQASPSAWLSSACIRQLLYPLAVPLRGSSTRMHPASKRRERRGIRNERILTSLCRFRASSGREESYVPWTVPLSKLAPHFTASEQSHPGSVGVHPDASLTGGTLREIFHSEEILPIPGLGGPHSVFLSLNVAAFSLEEHVHYSTVLEAFPVSLSVTN